MSIETYREEQEANYAESHYEKFTREDVYGDDETVAGRVIKNLNTLVGADVFSISEDQEEHEHDRDAEEVSDYQCDEERYN